LDWFRLDWFRLELGVFFHRRGYILLRISLKNFKVHVPVRVFNSIDLLPAAPTLHTAGISGTCVARGSACWGWRGRCGWCAGAETSRTSEISSRYARPSSPCCNQCYRLSRGNLKYIFDTPFAG